MKQQHQPAAAAASLSFTSPSSLADLLRCRIPPESLSLWGVAPGTKTLHNLWLEISQGESSLLQFHDRSLQRTVNVATLKINNNNKPCSSATLIESRQLLSDGTFRVRNRPLSEKMSPGESIQDAALRAVREELGKEMKATVLMDTYRVKEEERSSLSYPGLPSLYVLHSVHVHVEGIPPPPPLHDDDGGPDTHLEFSTEEYGEEKGEEANNAPAVFVRKHFWRWVYDYDNTHSTS